MSHLIVNGVDKTLDHIYVNTGSVVKEAWEARDKNDNLLWGRADTFTGTSSISARCYGLPVKSWEIDGNSQQSGVPSPQSIIMPTFCGVKTGNLANLYNANARQVGLTFSATDNMRIVINGTKTDGANIVPIKRPNIILPAGTYTVKIKMVSGEITGLTSDGIMFGINASSYGQRTTVVTKVGEIGKRTFTLSEETTVSSFDITPSYGSVGAVFDNATFECWLYSGSGDISYEPYGWAEKITCAGQTVPVYLGQVSTVRRIKKLVLTGQEDITSAHIDVSLFNIPINDYLRIKDTVTNVCSHYQAETNVSGWSEVTDLTCRFYANTGSPLTKIFYIRDSSFSTVTDFKSYLAAQYAAGTPVTVWYVLATPTTGIVNEPLCKIGTYADELHSADAGVTIPTTDGNTTISVDTSLAPSRFEIKVHAKAIAP